MKTCRFFSSSPIQDLCRRYPFPTTKNPSPHEIFHLQPGADQQTIKARYYDLVKIHHPDTAIARNVPPQIAQARFQLVSAAYERLQNPSYTNISRRNLSAEQRDQIYWDEIRRRTQHYRYGVRDRNFRDYPTANTGAQTLWQRDEGFLFVFVMLSAFAIAYHSIMPTPFQLSREQHDRTRRNLYDARKRGKEDGMRRRDEIKRWLRERQAIERQDSTVPSSTLSNPELKRDSTSDSRQYLKLSSSERNYDREDQSPRPLKDSSSSTIDIHSPGIPRNTEIATKDRNEIKSDINQV
ncbi:hypothetical protein FS842_000067 [Serendipita sp. 407]|nr:hypothetical protein FRC20_002012 [Serendipita sp. 405]KAG9058870.1 hypothetical protein FS842_000067 [Serendipita sp. 407]